MSNPFSPFKNQPPVEGSEIAKALVVLLESQDQIMEMLWSIRRGIDKPGFLDDTGFSSLKMRRTSSRNELKNKFGVY